MRRFLAAALLALTAACAPEKSRDFELGLIGPVGPGVEAASRAAGMSIREAAPEGADVHGVGVAFKGASGRSEERLADWAHLRLLVARAAVRGRTGVFFILPKSADGREVTSYPEEWQALARVAHETSAMRPILESGVEAAVPFPVPDGVQARAWRFQGRLYLLLVNGDGPSAPLPDESLRPWRALFEVRADTRDLLNACGGGCCLPGDRVLWLEGRLW
ncbi:MAG: hypothetical protein AAB268_02270 [Elusimicrobiota bacterium]